MAQHNGVQGLVRRTHEDHVLDVLRTHGELTRAEISAYTGISRTTISEITSDLLLRRAISLRDAPEPPSGRGRPARTLRLDPAAGQYIGVDFRRSLVRVVVANAARELIASDAAGYDSSAPWESRIAAARDLLDAMRERHGVHITAALGIAVGLPGPFSPHVPHVPHDAETSPSEARRNGAEQVRNAFARAFHVEVLLDNNTRLAALAEATWRRNENAGHLLYLRLSYGIGGGLVTNGRLVVGAAGLAGEFGHMTVPNVDTACRCGKRGCLETVASIDAILDACAAAGLRVTTLAELTDIAGRGDPIAVGVLRQAGAAVGSVLGSLAVALNPAEIVIGGEVASLSDVLLAQIAETVTYELLPVAPYLPTIRAAALGDDAAAIGGIAALLRRSPLLSGYPQAPASSDRHVSTGGTR